MHDAKTDRIVQAAAGREERPLAVDGDAATRWAVAVADRAKGDSWLSVDLGAPTPVIPPHLRRAVTLRDRHCRFPGCQQPPSVTQVHHLIPRARAGPTALDNLALLCRFHHLIVVHRWGWALTCHSDGTSTAVSPEGRTLHSHGPPSRAA